MLKLSILILCIGVPAAFCGTFLRTKRQEPKRCVCVPYYQCGPDNKIDVYGTDQLDQRIPLDGDPNPTCSGVDICCELPDDCDDGPCPASTTKGPVIPPDPVESPDDGERRKPPIPPPPGGSEILIPQLPHGLSGCGLKRINPLDPRILPDNDTAIRITGNNDKPENTFFGEFPWMVALFKETGGKKNFVCGGSIITPEVVLTGAHCVSSSEASELVVRAGDWDSRSSEEPIPHQDRKVSRISIHKDFDSGNLRNDIAVLTLATPFQLGESIDTVCVAKEGSFVPKSCFATGWGVNSFSDKGLYQPILKKVNLPLVDRETCQARLRTTRLGSYFKLHKSFICAGGVVNQDTCTGDGGGPLVCSGVDGSPYKFAQLGVVSWGIGCGKETPAVYSSVSHFYDWITQTNHIIL